MKKPAPAKPPTARQRIGQAGEDQALAHLIESGLILVARNFRCKAGEIDLIMRESQTLVFVEVRKRASSGFGGAAASVTYRKQQRLILAAQFYLLRFSTPPICRFDVIAIDNNDLSWIKDAIQT
jgi:putative endonuclease